MDIQAKEQEQKQAILAGEYARAGEIKAEIEAYKRTPEYSAHLRAEIERKNREHQAELDASRQAAPVVDDFFGGNDMAANSQRRAAEKLDRIEAGEDAREVLGIADGERSRQKAAADNAAWDFFDETDGVA